LFFQQAEVGGLLVPDEVLQFLERDFVVLAALSLLHLVQICEIHHTNWCRKSMLPYYLRGHMVSNDSITSLVVNTGT
jgi:hypothetical protein